MGPRGLGYERRSESIGEVARPERHVNGVLAQSFERNDLKGTLVRRGQHHVRRRTVVMGTEPVGGGHAPPVAGTQSGEPVFGHRRGEIVANGSLVLEKLGGDDGANCVAPQILRSTRATTVAVEARNGIGTTGLQWPTHDVAIGHGPLSLLDQ